MATSRRLARARARQKSPINHTIDHQPQANQYSNQPRPPESALRSHVKRIPSNNNQPLTQSNNQYTTSTPKARTLTRVHTKNLIYQRINQQQPSNYTSKHKQGSRAQSQIMYQQTNHCFNKISNGYEPKARACARTKAKSANSHADSKARKAAKIKLAFSHSQQSESRKHM